MIHPAATTRDLTQATIKTPKNTYTLLATTLRICRTKNGTYGFLTLFQKFMAVMPNRPNFELLFPKCYQSEDLRVSAMLRASDIRMQAVKR